MTTKQKTMTDNPLALPNNVFRLIKFSIPSIITMLFMSLYTMIDGAFVSQFVGPEALSAINITYPIINVLLAIGIMLAAGGSAVIAKKLGEQKSQEANEDFTAIFIYGCLSGLIITSIILIFIEPILKFLGATPEIYDYCYEYTFYIILFSVACILQIFSQFFFITSGKPALGMFITISGGISNIIFDYIFIVPLNMGIKGAALATGIGYLIPGIFGLLYFSLNRKNTLCFVKPVFRLQTLYISCLNGSSEMVTNLSSGVTTYLFNIMTLKYMGIDGVAAITIILYSQFTLTSIYLGYSSGIAPIISYNYGNQNTSELKKIYKISLFFIGIVSLITFIFANFGMAPIINIFTGSESSSLFTLTLSGMKLFSFAYLFMGTNIFASTLFTALENGKVSAKISFLRTFAFICPSILFLPLLFDINGIWLAVPFSELLSFIFSIVYLQKYKKLYCY